MLAIELPGDGMSIKHHRRDTLEIRTFAWKEGTQRWTASFQVGGGPIVDLAARPVPTEAEAHDAALQAADIETARTASNDLERNVRSARAAAARLRQTAQRMQALGHPAERLFRLASAGEDTAKLIERTAEILSASRQLCKRSRHGMGHD